MQSMRWSCSAPRRGHQIVTSDPKDLERLEPGVELIVV